jgi:probable rRNA maturation factor
MRNILIEHGIKKTTFGLTLVSNNQIQKLNLQFAGKNRPTDVLAFSLGENDILGDVIVSVDMAKRQAKEYNNTIFREICHLSIHGLLHLLGYDDATEKQRKIMEEITREIVDQI